jgi:hypothetical protein
MQENQIRSEPLTAIRNLKETLRTQSNLITLMTQREEHCMQVLTDTERQVLNLQTALAEKLEDIENKEIETLKASMAEKDEVIRKLKQEVARRRQEQEAEAAATGSTMEEADGLRASPVVDLRLGPAAAEEAVLTCRVCLQGEIGLAFLPCGHQCCCPACGQGMDHCPVCRQRVAARIRVFNA